MIIKKTKGELAKLIKEEIDNLNKNENLLETINSEEFAKIFKQLQENTTPEGLLGKMLNKLPIDLSIPLLKTILKEIKSSKPSIVEE